MLTVMLESEELNITEISRRAGLSHASAVRHLEFLTKSGITTEKRFNRIRIFRLERTSPKVRAIARFFEEWKDIDQSAGAADYA